MTPSVRPLFATRIRRLAWAALLLIALGIALSRTQAIQRLLAPSLTITPAHPSLVPGAAPITLQLDVHRKGYVGPIRISLDNVTGNLTAEPLTLTGTSSGTLTLHIGAVLDEKWDARSALLVTAGTRRIRIPLRPDIPVSRPSVRPDAPPSALPVLRIETPDAQHPPINGQHVPAALSLRQAGGQGILLTDAAASIHVRGNTTRDMPKKPYTLKLSRKTDLMRRLGIDCGYRLSPTQTGCNESKRYVLLANWADKSLLRNWAAFQLARSIPIGAPFLDSPPGSPTPSGSQALMPWAPHSAFVALYLNGAYEGVYQLAEQPRIDRHTINLSKQGKHPDITGGYLLEIDDRQKRPFHFTTPRGLNISMRDPETPKGLASLGYISYHVSQAETALFSTASRDPRTGWRAWFDQAAAVNYYLVNDIMGNADGGSLYSSVYLYKARNNPLLYMGPVWDFDVSAGNLDFYPIASPFEPWTQESLWYRQWFLDPGFKAAVARQFNTLKAHHVFDDWLAAIEAQAHRLQADAAANFDRWPILNVKVWPNPQTAGSYQGEVDYLLDYLRLRLAYLDAQFNPRPAAQVSLSAATRQAKVGTPVTLTAHVTTHGAPPEGRVNFLLNYWEYPFIGPSAVVSSTGEARAVLQRARPGRYTVTAVYSGDAHHGLARSSPVVVQITPHAVAQTQPVGASVE
ncbi:hypothetical protein CCAE64S_01145 [Castellaniella caeni]